MVLVVIMVGRGGGCAADEEDEDEAGGGTVVDDADDTGGGGGFLAIVLAMVGGWNVTLEALLPTPLPVRTKVDAPPPTLSTPRYEVEFIVMEASTSSLLLTTLLEGKCCFCLVLWLVTALLGG